MPTPASAGAEHSSQPERGASGAEYVAMIMVGALVVAALGAVLMRAAPSVTEAVEHAVCTVTSPVHGGDCGDGPGEIRLPEDYVPSEECVLGGSGQSASGSASFTFVKVEGGESWLIEELGNGEYRLTRASESGVGLTAGAGAEAYWISDNHRYGVGAWAEANAMLAFEQGDVFYADSPEMAETILSHQLTADVKDSTLGPLSGPVDWVGDNTPLWGGPGEYENLEPDEWWVEGGLDLNARAAATGLASSAEAEAAAEAYVGTKQRSDGTSSVYFDFEVSGGVNLQAGDFESEAVAGIEGAASGTVELEMDADGNVVAMSMKSGLMGHADAGWRENVDNPTYTETTVQIPIETDADRQVAHAAMVSLGIPYTPGVSDGLSADDLVSTPGETYQAATEFAQLAQERGYVYQEEYEVGTSVDGGGVNIGLGLEVGGGLEVAETVRTLTDYQYWDGTGMVSREGCVA